MDLKAKTKDKFEKAASEILVFAVLTAFAFFINRGVELKGLYMDDLYLWSCYGEQSFTEFVFPTDSTRFRFIFYLAAWLELFLIGDHITWMVPINIILNSLIAFTVYEIGVRVSRERKYVSLALAFAFLLSRLSYYQIGQFYGLMESLSLWAAIGILYFLYRYINESDIKCYAASCVLYFVVCFIHERYMALLPLLILAVFIAVREQDVPRGAKAGESGANKPLLIAITLGIFAAVQMIRFIAIGTLVPAGTGGTSVGDTFSVIDTIVNALREVAFVFGISTGPDYLSIMSFGESPLAIQILIIATDLVIAAIVILFAVRVFKDRDHAGYFVRNLALFLTFIVLCIASSSVTIRIEMRWIYVVYAAALLFMAFMSADIGKAAGLVFLYVLLLIPTETFYRDGWDNLYYMPDQERVNSLAEETVGEYGDEIYEKDVYIIGNSYGFSDFTLRTFLKVYDRDRTDDETRIMVAENEFDVPEITDNMVVLREVPSENAYENVTEILKTQRFDYVYGSYDDGWIDENARIDLLAPDSDTLTLQCYYPGTITGGEIVKIRMNGEELPDLVLTDNMTYYELSVAPREKITLEFSCNFYVEGAREKRGDDNLAMIVGFIAPDGAY